METKTPQAAASEIIDAMGGTCAVAALCEVTSGAVSQWRTNGIPRHWRKFIERERPDLASIFRATE